MWTARHRNSLYLAFNRRCQYSEALGERLQYSLIVPFEEWNRGGQMPKGRMLTTIFGKIAVDKAYTGAIVSANSGPLDFGQELMTKTDPQVWSVTSNCLPDERLFLLPGGHAGLMLIKTATQDDQTTISAKIGKPLFPNPDWLKRYITVLGRLLQVQPWARPKSMLQNEKSLGHSFTVVNV